ncbi:MAG: phosphate/phosphite/phosphonate ABC transporter substrate-binding protein [Candidatus Thiodiazotropha sp. 'RUGA']|nr:phosphate/phosphite/phosphonate ABC transporter substrate-binding protein [Candidatus Thiodiazotropha sp. 'RUGA']
MHNLKRLNLGWWLLWLHLLIVPGQVTGDDGLRFYYFNPDSPQNNLGRLKSDMESLLEGFDLAIEFQPFAHLTDFDARVRSDRPAFVFAPHWYLKRNADEIRFNPLLQSVHQQQNSYRKLLVARLGSDEINRPERLTLAMTSLGPGSKQLLANMLNSDGFVAFDKLSIVEVPKDADAIFAAALGQVDVALVSQANMKLFRKINPRLIDSLKVISESTPIDMPVLGYIDGVVTKEQAAALKQFMFSSQNSTVMQTLQIEGWSSHER